MSPSESLRRLVHLISGKSVPNEGACGMIEGHMFTVQKYDVRLVGKLEPALNISYFHLYRGGGSLL